METVNLYLFDISSKTIEQLEQSPFLTPNNIKELSKITNEQTRKEKLASQILKNQYIGDYYLGEKGKPLSDKICFNISHSHSLVVLAISEHPIGVDIELVRDTDEKLIKHTCSDEELKYIKGNKEFYKIWTSKEALMKCIGDGINMNLKDIPALPISGSFEYKENSYYRKSLKHNNYILSVVVRDTEEFNIKIN